MFSTFAIIVALAVILISNTLVLGVIFPFSSVIVRYRANFTPKGLNLTNSEEEGLGGAQTLSQDPRVGPVVNSIWAMCLRVKRIEGWAGFYKGLSCVLIISGVVLGRGLMLRLYSADAIVFRYDWGYHHDPARRDKNYIARPLSRRAGESLHRPGDGHSRDPPHSPIGHHRLSVRVVILYNTDPTDLPRSAITTPHKLGSFAVMKSLRTLLTPHERRAPWALYFTPGLLASRFATLFWMLFVVRTARLILVPALAAGLPTWAGQKPPNRADVSTVGLSIFILFAAFSCVVLCPLEVIATRLAIQRNHAGTFAYDEANTEEGEQVAYAGETEDVIGLRNEEDPYVGLVDCAKRIANEEGPQTLYRAWWLTMIASVIASLA
jgi:hypothetical protein